MADFTIGIENRSLTLKTLATAKIYNQLWKRSLENVREPDKVCIYWRRWDDRNFSGYVINEDSFKAALSNRRFYWSYEQTICQPVTLIVRELERHAEEEIINFLSHSMMNRVKVDPNILLHTIHFTQYGTVNHSDTFRAALPLIQDPSVRFAIVSKYVMLDMLDGAWEDVKLIFDYGCFSKNWGSSVKDNIFETYFACLKMNKLAEFKADVYRDYYRHDPVQDALECSLNAVHSVSLEAVKYFLNLLPEETRTKFIIKMFSQLISVLARTSYDKYNTDHILVNYAYLFNSMTPSERLVLFESHAHVLIMCWEVSEEYGWCLMPFARQLFPYLTNDMLEATLKQFLKTKFCDVAYFYQNSKEYRAIFLNYLSELPDNLRDHLYTQPQLIYEMMLKRGDTFVRALLKDKGEVVVLGYGLELCVYLIVNQLNMWQYIHVFLSEIVPTGCREEFQSKLSERVLKDSKYCGELYWGYLQKIYSNVAYGLDSFHSSFYGSQWECNPALTSAKFLNAYSSGDCYKCKQCDCQRSRRGW